jgi:hypothetical protein
MKQNNLSTMIGVATAASIFLLLFVVGFTLLHQIINFLETYRAADLY